MGPELFVAWQEADSPGWVEVVLTSEYADELMSLLAEYGIDARLSGAPVRSAGDLLTTVVAAAGSSVTVGAVGMVLRLFFNRHKGKRLTVDGVVAVENLSAKDIEKIIKTLAEHGALHRDGLQPALDAAVESADETAR